MYRKRRRAFGLCGHAKCLVFTGDDSFYCAQHAAQERVRQRKRTADRRAVRLAARGGTNG